MVVFFAINFNHCRNGFKFRIKLSKQNIAGFHASLVLNQSLLNQYKGEMILGEVFTFSEIDSSLVYLYPIKHIAPKYMR